MIPKATGEEKASLLARTKVLAAEVKSAEAAQTAAEAAWRDALMAIPNVAADEAPSGGEEDFIVLETVGTPRDFTADGFEPRDHIELGKMLGAIDLERGAKVSGSRFYFLTGVGAQLEFALINLAMEQAREAGFTQVIAPSLVNPRAMDGTGFLGQAADDVYRIEGEDLYLVGTSEVPMAAYHSDEILDGESLPLRYAAFSPCFRKEAGSHGKDTKGIIRVHWFDKVEMFVYSTMEDSYAEHQRLLDWEKQFLDKLELAYQVIDVAAGDLGPERTTQVRLRGVDPDPGEVSRVDLDLQLHRLPDSSPRHPWSVRRRRPTDRHSQRHAMRDDSHHRCDPGDPPAGRWLRPTAGRPPEVDGHRCLAAGRPVTEGRETGSDVSPTGSDVSPPWKVVALDIDGTLLTWIEGSGQTAEVIPARVYDAVHAARAAGALIVLGQRAIAARHDSDRRSPGPTCGRG